MKKHKPRRKAPPRHQKGGRRVAKVQPLAAPVAGAGVFAASAVSEMPQQLWRRRQALQTPAARSGSGLARGSVALGRVDWPALAIVLVPLGVLALLDLQGRVPRDVSRPPIEAPEASVRVPAEAASAWHGDLTIEAMPVAPDTRSRMALVDTEPQTPPWRGDLALEDMPVVPDARTRTAIAPIVPPQPAMPIAPVTRRADIATTPMPICLPPQPSVLSAVPRGDSDVSSRHPVHFGRALAAAARAQLDEFVIYNPRYVTLAYPGGDTQPLYGVCTDVVVRAYRAFGIDFQELIHTSRLGRGDPSIDHRRVEVIRRFLERYGTSFEISEFPEDFRAGDIVTYQRPQGRVSQHHIAVVSDQLAPSGRPLIVHNRGWGPQLEDALFVDRITGHYRFSPADAEAFERTRQPQPAGRHRTADVASSKGR